CANASRNVLLKQPTANDCKTAVLPAHSCARWWPLHFRLFGQLECVIDLDAEVSNGTLELRMTEEELHCTQILRAAIDQRGFRASRCMGSIRGGVEADLPYPPADDSRVLPGRQMRRGMQAARKQGSPPGAGMKTGSTPQGIRVFAR